MKAYDMLGDSTTTEKTKDKVRVMVCVTRQHTCERLIREGAAIAKSLNGELHVVHVAKSGASFLGADADDTAIGYLYRVARNYSSDLTILRSDNVIATLRKFARDKKIQCLVVGSAGPGSSQNIVIDLLRHLPGVDIREVFT